MKKIKGLVSLLCIVLLLSGCSIRITKPGETNSDGSDMVSIEGKNVLKEDASEAKSVKLDFKMSVADFTFVANESNEFTGEAEFNRKRLEHTLELNGDADKTYKIRPKYKNVGGFTFGSRSKCTIKASSPKEVPTMMELDLGVGKSNIDLTGINLSKLDVSSGVGDSYLKFDEEYPQEIEMSYSGGVGKLELQIGGTYKEGVEAKMEAGVGNMTVDVSGNFEKELNMEVEGGVGNFTITIDKASGVKVIGEKGEGSLSDHEDGKKTSLKSNEEYKSKNYNDSTSIINLDVEAGVGNIKIIIK